MRSLVLTIVLSAAAFAQGNGSFDAEAVREALESVRDAAQEAYEVLLQDQPDAAGNVTLTFTISRDGFVGEVAVEADTVLAPVADVLSGAVSELRFAPLAQGSTPIEISVPFEFRPPEE